ncbi:MAG TPA: DUF4396 domain-containing protein [Rhizomicrobium sp.]|nr:DUF4396 domain-containing protein [Rhizomicrobium sp.]
MAANNRSQFMVPAWLHILSIVALLAGALCASVIAWDEFRHPQHMWIMNLVWPLVALFGTAAVLVFYFRFGRSHGHFRKPTAVSVAEAAFHCGSGCTLGDIIAETLAYTFPAVAVWFGWQSLFGEKMFAVWVLDFIFAFVLGIAFQYFTIKPMRGLRPREALIEALKADTLSLIAWQVGMYGLMAIAQFGIFRGAPLSAATPEFWFMMQIAMIAGFATAYPVNWWLVKIGIKEPM